MSYERFSEEVLKSIKCCLCNNFPVDPIECDKCADLFCSRCLDLYQSKSTPRNNPFITRPTDKEVAKMPCPDYHRWYATATNDSSSRDREFNPSPQIIRKPEQRKQINKNLKDWVFSRIEFNACDCCEKP